MEIRAYIEGILRSSWLLVLILVLSIWVGTTMANNQTLQYQASTTILINESLLANTAVSLNGGQISSPLVYESQITAPDILTIINKHYPRLNPLTLAKIISVSTDASNQLLTINFTDTSPTAAADVVNYLAQQFVQKETADLKHRLDYYESTLKQQTIPTLTNQINNLNTAIQNIQTNPVKGQARAEQQTITQDEYQLNIDEADLYTDQEALKDIQLTRPLFKSAYVIMQPAVVSPVTSTSTLSILQAPSVIEVLAVLVGLLIGIIVLIAVDYFNPFVRHKGEIQRIVGLPVLAALPGIFRFEQKRLLEERTLFFRWRTKALLLVCSLIGAPAIKDDGQVVLVTSLRRKKYNFAAIVATILAHTGFKTLLIDANFANPQAHQHIQIKNAYHKRTQNQLDLSFIHQTAYPRLFVLPANALSAQGTHVTSIALAQLLPELRSEFAIIIIDGPAFSHADTHVLAPSVTSTLLLVRKRRDSIKALKTASQQCQNLNLDVQSLLL